MTNRLLFICAAFMVALLLAFNKAKSFPESSFIKSKQARQVIRCGPDWEQLKEWLDETEIPPIPGAGNYHWKINTRFDSAQFYFNQGINTYYSFHIIESMASFKKAVRFDPNSAMIFWGQALAYGPNINDYGYAASPEALNAINKAKELSVNCSSIEKALIGAMSVRYTADSADLNRTILNQRYTAEMKKIYNQFPKQADLATLYADAMMLEHPWDLWFNDGRPKPWTNEIREVLENVLSFAPNNPGANHYYIHVMEPSPFPEKALPSANRLGKLTPGLSHTVHMPSHIYLRTGNYLAGIKVNEEAVKKYTISIPLFEAVKNSDFLYLIHNLHMQVNNAMLAGRYAYSMKTADALLRSIRPEYLDIPGPLGNLVQYIYMTPTLINIRFSKWDNLLAAKEPGAKRIYARILFHFGRGMAFTGSSHIDEAREELGMMQILMRDSSLYLPFTPFSPAIDGAAVAENLLAGSIAQKLNKMDQAEEKFELAVYTEEHMVYDEPRDWMLNPGPFYGNALFQMGKFTEAKAAFEKDLSNNKENGWSLFGVYQVLKAEKKNSEMLRLWSRYKKAFSQADIQLSTAIK